MIERTVHVSRTLLQEAGHGLSVKLARAPFKHETPKHHTGLLSPLVGDLAGWQDGLGGHRGSPPVTGKVAKTEIGVRLDVPRNTHNDILSKIPTPTGKVSAHLEQQSTPQKTMPSIQSNNSQEKLPATQKRFQGKVPASSGKSLIPMSSANRHRKLDLNQPAEDVPPIYNPHDATSEKYVF